MRKFILILALSVAALVGVWAARNQFLQSRWQRSYAEATSLYWDGKPGDAEKELKDLLPSTETNWPQGWRLGVTLNLLGLTQRAQGRDKEAEPLLQRAIQILTKDLGPNSMDTAKAEDNLGILYLDAGRTADAEPWLQKSLDAYKASPSNAQAELGNAFLNLGQVRMRQGRYIEAGSLFEQASLVEQQFLPNAEAIYIRAGLAQADSYRLQSRFADAKNLYAKSLSALQAQGQAGIPGVSMTDELLRLGYVLAEEGETSEATHVASQIEEVATKWPDTRRLERVTTLSNLAYIYERAADINKAEALSRQSVADLEKIVQPGDAQLANAYFILGRILTDRGKYADASSYLERALKAREVLLGANHYSTATVASSLAEVRVQEHRYAEAKDLAQRALPIQEKAGGETVDVARTLERLAAAQQGLGDLAGAEASLKRAVSIREQHQLPSHPAYAQSLQNLAKLYSAEKKEAEASALLKKLQEIRAAPAAK